jgi:hypothetical protein
VLLLFRNLMNSGSCAISKRKRGGEVIRSDTLRYALIRRKTIYWKVLCDSATPQGQPSSSPLSPQASAIPASLSRPSGCGEIYNPSRKKESSGTTRPSPCLLI